jgi:hypothetical protein
MPDLNDDPLARDPEASQVTAGRKAGWRAERWGVIWHYALIAGSGESAAG